MRLFTCQSGHDEWVSTSNGACFVSRNHNSFSECMCPISSCVKNTETGVYGCEFTPFTQSIIAVLAGGLVILTLFTFYWKKVNISTHVVVQPPTEMTSLLPNGKEKSSLQNKYPQ
eukprot:Tbor_TRINITY_DN5093_c1_g5::TRINITY_DN5093_c1_g5_i1::g.14089::m.14089